MTSKEPTPYEAPTLVTYGTVRELTLGSGGTNIPDIGPCAVGSHRAANPSGITCKTGG